MAAGQKRKRSGRVRHFDSSVAGHTQTFTPTAISNKKTQDALLQEARIAELTDEQRAFLLKLQDYPNTTASESQDWEDVDMDVDDGDGAFPMSSHEGGELKALLNMQNNISKSHRHRVDNRTRNDREENRDKAFRPQIHTFTDAFMSWSNNEANPPTHTVPDIELPEGSTGYPIRVVDVFATEMKTLSITPADKYPCTAFVRQGVIPSAPSAPTVGFKIRSLELFRILHLRCPRLSQQAYVKTLSDIQTVQYQRYLTRQFSIAYDIYLEIRQNVDACVAQALGRDDGEYRLKHTCPACMYKLHDELVLIFDMLWAMDGNDSLKRILCRSAAPADDPTTLGPSRERTDTRTISGDLYISREDVDNWAKGKMEESRLQLPTDHPDYNPCAERWSNMREEITNRMWGIFDETGIFAAFCRHGFALVVSDMVRSGEQFKYPLATVEKMIKTFGPNQGGGYDTGCQFGTTLANSPLGARAKKENYTQLIDAFHGHAHRRLCQLRHLATYQKGLGLEDLGVCERAFSRSNALGGVVRHMSVFHRIQAINNYFIYTDDLETYQNLTTLLLNKYKAALRILSKSPAVLARTMQDMGIESIGVFDDWLVEERIYLEGLKREPEQETLHMEYYQKLVKLWESKATFDHATAVFLGAVPGTQDLTRPSETKRRHALEKYDKDVDAVHALEVRLAIVDRWVIGGPECVGTAKLVSMRKYQRALDDLEGLVVARIFELTKMNRSQTGYALRKHIAEALSKRSVAVRAALDRYNVAAKALRPQRQTLKWEDVVEYAFVSEFDLLRDTRQDIQHRPWATPAGRAALDTSFKIIGAGDEIDRLNIEVLRVATHIYHEDLALRGQEDRVRLTDPPLAHQIKTYREIRGRFNGYHVRRIRQIIKLPGYTGSTQLGIPVGTTPALPCSSTPSVSPSTSAISPATPPHASASPPQIPVTMPHSPIPTMVSKEIFNTALDYDTMGQDAPSVSAAERLEEEELEKEEDEDEVDREVNDDLVDILRTSFDS